jgi:hypothetical protein
MNAPSPLPLQHPYCSGIIGCGISDEGIELNASTIAGYGQGTKST